MKRTALLYIIIFASFYAFSQSSNVGIGIPNPQAKLDIAGALKLDSAKSDGAGMIQFRDGKFLGNVDGSIAGWRRLNSPWIENQYGQIYFSPAQTGLSVIIGDSLETFGSKLYVHRHLLGFGGTSILGRTSVNQQVIAEGFLGHQVSNFPALYKFNFGVLGNVYDDASPSTESFGVAGNNMENDTSNYGGYFLAQGFGGLQNVGVYGAAINGQKNWAALFDGNALIKNKLAIGTDIIDDDAVVHMKVSDSGNFPHLRIDSPVDQNGFGITLRNPQHEFLIGQNIGNWNDGRFQIVSGSSFNWFTILQNGDIGLTNSSFTTPFARLQVGPKGSLNDGGGLNLDNTALYIGESQSTGLAFDENQIESVGNDLNLNFNSSHDVLLVNGGGLVGVDVTDPNAKLHVGEGHTVLFGNDTIGKTNFYPDAKLMFKPGRGGAFRVGQLNADGSLIGGTGYNYWDHSLVGWASVAIGNNTKATGAGSVALGIRSNATNFGAVALGHLSRTIGNSGIAAGYYTRADAFVSCAVGAGNTGGGHSNLWQDLDPIFEVGNSIDTSNRSNALTILKNARVGINHSNPAAMLDIEQPNPGPGNGVLLNLSGIGHWETMVDNAADYNFYFNNSLKSYIRDTDGEYIVYSDLRLKEEIRPVENVLFKLESLTPSTYRFKDTKSDIRSIGFIAQEVQQFFPDLVTEKNEYLGVNYSGFHVLAVKAIQELSVQNKAMSARINQQQILLDQLILEVEKLKQNSEKN